MQVAFRVDASRSIGTGHVVRCMSLARTLAHRGAHCVFIHREQPGCMTQWLQCQGFQVLKLPDKVYLHDHTPEKLLASEQQQEDVQETLHALDGSHIDWMVVDHYALDAQWEQTFSRGTTKCLAVDDLANRRHIADILLDQNYFVQPEHRYDTLTDSDTLRLLGPDYALVDCEYQRLRAMLDAPRETLRRILVFHGGTDPEGASLTALKALSSSIFSSISVEVVIGLHNPNREALLEFAANHPNIVAHEPRQSLAGLMLRADLMLGAGGTTTWERCVMRLPALVTTIAPNQRLFTYDMDKAGALIDLGSVESVTSSSIAQKINALSKDPNRLRQMSIKSGEICDGWGCQRVAEFLLPTKKHYCIGVDKQPDETIDFRNVEDFLVGQAELKPGQAQNERELRIRLDTACPQDYAQKALTCQLLTALQSNNCFDWFLRYPITNPKARDGFRITVLSDPESWINDYVPDYLSRWLTDGHAVRWVSDTVKLEPGDFCFILGCTRLITESQRNLNHHNLVVHESDLPRGRGFSPLTWQILEGRNEIPICLLEAEEKADVGRIYLKDRMHFKGTELIDELRKVQAAHTWKLCRRFIEEYPSVVDRAVVQSGQPTWYPRRTPEDSQLDVKSSLISIFDHLRTVDPLRYPAWFDLRGKRYSLQMHLIGDTPNSTELETPNEEC